MFVLLGANGQITAQLARLLLAAGKPVRVIGRRAEALAPLAAAGAETVAGDPGDRELLAAAFADATAVYAMTPPCYDAPDMRAAQDRIGTAIASALARSRVRRVVQLSSIGAELSEGTGPIEGLHAQEVRLRALPDLDLLQLRPGSFMENLLAVAPVVAAAGILPGMEAADVPIPLVATADIAAVAARELTQPTRRGTLLLTSPDVPTMREVAAVLGQAIGQPELRYVQTPADVARAQLQQQGFSADAARQLERLAIWLSRGTSGSASAAPVEPQPTRLASFARTHFAPAVAAARVR